MMAEYEDLIAEQKEQAKQSRRNLPGYQQQFGAQSADTIGNQLQDKLGGIRQAASRRGLLYSGIRQGAEAGATGQALNDINRQQLEVNQNLENQANDLEKQSISGRLAGYESDVNNEMKAYQQRLQQAQQNQAMRSGIFGTLAQGGLMAAFSDKDLKKDIKPGDHDVKSMLDAISAKTYKYKDEKDGEGKFAGPIAQDLEKTEIGKSLVHGTRHGKMIDYAKGFNTLLASQAALNKRLNKIEASK